MPALAAGQVDGIFTDLPPFRLRNNYRGPWQLLSSCWRRFEMPRTSVRPACTRRDAPAVPHVREQPSELSRSIGNRFDACAVAALASCTGRVRTSARVLLAARDSASKLRAAAAVSENSLTRASSARRGASRNSSTARGLRARRARLPARRDRSAEARRSGAVCYPVVTSSRKHGRGAGRGPGTLP